MLVQDADGEIESFIARWSASGGAERSNFQLFAVELCRLLDVDEPRPARENINRNDYTFERSVEFKGPDGSTSPGRIDLYKRGCFVMEAKQSRERGRPKAVVVKGQPDFFRPEVHPRGKASAHRAWDVLMLNARRQAEDYARALPTSHGWPPFVIVCDVGHCFEVFADFSGQGKNYAQFPDRQGYRIHLEDLRKPEVRTFLAAVWREPHGLDPARQSAKVTREIAERLAKVSKALEERGYKTEDVAWFLMRCLFTMFAEDVNLLPRDGFKNLLTRCRDNTKMFAPMTEQLWKVMNTGGFAYAIEQHVLHFNGHFFDKATAMPLRREDIGELLAAAKADWRQVEPAIFGTLLEQALTETERARLGAHYTPRAYVERLVVATVIEPLRQEWAEVQATAERLKEEQRTKDAIAGIRAFHDKLCTTRVLDPACGTGNFLYLALELMKKLEGEVLDALVALGGQEVLALEKQTIGPNQFLGLEVNPRAAAIAELVVWLGYLQWHFRTQGGAPSEPILRDFGNVAAMDAVLDWTGHPVSKIALREDGSRVETYPNARRPDWPEAEFIVGNPPFIGGKDIRAQLGSSYAETLWRVHDHINESADLVMYWWDRAADILTAKASKLRRFGFVTTNSITQTFSRRVVARHLESKRPLSLAMAVPDHPWTKATPDHAAVRIAMTVAERGKRKGVLCEIIHEAGIDTDRPRIEMTERRGRINADLTVGADATQARALKANEGLCSPGVKLHGTGFIVTPNEARHLGLGKRRGLDKHVRPYRNGRDLTAIPRGVMAIDLFGLQTGDVRRRFPEVYQHLLAAVKPERDRNRRETYRDNWWVFGEPRSELRPALAGLSRYIATVETAKHRIFQFLDAAILPDNKLIAIAIEDPYVLGVLSSRVHIAWALRAGGWLGQGNDSVYVKSRCFDPFPFPHCPSGLKFEIRAVAEELDAHRKACQAEHPALTLTQIYNVLGKICSGEPLDGKEERIKNQGLVLILKELHDKLDALVSRAYGWTDRPTDEQSSNAWSISTRSASGRKRPALSAGFVPSIRFRGSAPRPSALGSKRIAAVQPRNGAPPRARVCSLSKTICKKRSRCSRPATNSPKPRPFCATSLPRRRR